MCEEHHDIIKQQDTLIKDLTSKLIEYRKDFFELRELVYKTSNILKTLR
jgi:hypothetical protein